MRSKIHFITTTSSIEGHPIEKYLGLVTSQSVQGTDIFSDISAGWRDVFGGYSTSYQKKLKLMENRVLAELKLQASQIGANAIIGLKLDFDEISGKGKGMLMLTAQGTAVWIITGEQAINEAELKVVHYKELDYEIGRHRILKESDSSKFRVEEINDIAELANFQIDAFDKVISFIYNEPISLKEHSEMLMEYMSNVSMLSISVHIKSEHFLDTSHHSFKKLQYLLGLVDWFDTQVIFITRAGTAHNSSSASASFTWISTDCLLRKFFKRTI